jgi:phenylalanyl-tRNA synthetase alpha chain
MDIEKTKKEATKAIENCHDLLELEEVSRHYLGRKGVVSLFCNEISNQSQVDRKKLGQSLNGLKKIIEESLAKKNQELREKTIKARMSGGKIDIRQPGKKFTRGHLHPLTLVTQQVEDIFQLMGFSVVEGPELETEYYNFDALNIPKDHPARDAWDTFWIKGNSGKQKTLLRTHTSPNQIRYMEKNNPPLRIIVSGSCYRHEATDRSHGFQFMQTEGLMVGQEISLANFKSVVEKFCQMFFKKDVEIRITPDYFPFTEPSVEVSILDKNNNWLEVMGAGMVHPNVFKSVGYIPYEWQGFAFGVGLERLAMIKYGIDDVRMLYQGDLRLIQQF